MTGLLRNVISTLSFAKSRASSWTFSGLAFFPLLGSLTLLSGLSGCKFESSDQQTPPDPKAVEITKDVKSIPSVTAALTTIKGKDGVSLSWELAKDGNAQPITKYNIYRFSSDRVCPLDPVKIKKLSRLVESKFEAKESPAIYLDAKASVSKYNCYTVIPIYKALEAIAAANGSAVPPVGSVLPSVSSEDFGNVSLGNISTKTITLSSGTAGYIAALSVSVTDPQLAIENNTCGDTLEPGVLDPSSTCSFDLLYEPSAEATQALLTDSLVVSFTNGAAVKTLNLAIKGKRVSPAVLNASPLTYDFGNLTLNSGGTHVFTLTNGGDSPATDVYIALTGSGYALSSSTCGTLAAKKVIAPLGTCRFTVAFEPKAVGAATGSVALHYNDGIQDQASAVTASGVGIMPASLAFAPTLKDFGEITLGASASETFTLTNSGGSSASLTAVSLLGAGFTLGANTCGTSGGKVSLAPAGTCSFSVDFSPTQASAFTGAVSLSFFDGARSQTGTLALTGSGRTRAQLVFSPGSKSFGNVVLGLSDSAALTLSNTGGTDASGVYVGLTGSGYSLSSSNCGVLGTTVAVAAHSSCSLSLVFTPAAAGQASGSIASHYNDGVAAQSGSLSFSGIGLEPTTMAFSPTSFDFGNVTIGNSSAHLFTLLNHKPAAATNVSLSIAGAGFSLASNNCGVSGSAVSVAGGSSCTFSVVYAPGVSGAASGVISLSYTDGIDAQTGSLAVTAVGLTPASLAFAPGSKAFGDVTTGASSSESFTLTNSGQTGATSVYLGVSGAGYSLTSNNCGVTGSRVSVSAGGNCSFNLLFAPVSAGAEISSVSLSYNDGHQSQSGSVGATGTGILPALLGASESSHGYGNVTLSQTSARTFTFTNSQGTTASQMYASLSGTGFTITSNGCGTLGVRATLALNATCDVEVTFTPNASGAFSGTLSVYYNDGSQTQHTTTILTGTGQTVASLAFTPTSKDFGNVTQGLNASASFTLTNSGDLSATLVSLALSDSGFSLANNTCGVSATKVSVASGANCTFDVVFAPGSLGSFSGNLALSYNDTLAARAGSVALTGAAPLASAVTSTIVADAGGIADGVTTSAITVSLKDGAGNPVGSTPTLSVSGTLNTLACAATNATTGITACTLKSTKAETKTVTITAPAGLGAVSADIGFVAGDASVVTTMLSATTPKTADGNDASTVTITLKDVNSNLISGTTPTISATGTGNTVSACSSSDASGVSTCTIKSTKAESKTVTITSPAGLGALSAQAVFGAGVASSVTTTLSATTPKTADGADTSTVTVTLKDVDSNLITGTTPTISVTGPGNTVSTCSSSDASGVSICTISTTVAEGKTVTVLTPAGLGSLSANAMFVPVSAMKSTVSGLKLWYKADSILGLSSGSAVVSWSDSSGNSNAATQVTSNYEPLWIANALNSQPVVRFDGSNDTMNLASAMTTARTVFIVGKHSTGTQDYGAMLGSAATYYDFHGGTATALYLAATTNANILGGSVYSDGLSVSSASILKPTNYSLVSLVTAGNVGFDNIANDRGLAGRYWNGDFAEILVYSSALSAGDRQAVEAYLQGKYAMASAGNSTLTATANATADNTDLSTVTITMMNSINSALVGVTPTINVSGTGNTVNACSASNGSGVSTCTFKSSKAETKAVTITSPAGLSALGAQTVFGAGVASAVATTLTATTAKTSDGADAATATITLKDVNSNPIAGATPTISVTGAGNTVSVCSSSLASGVSTCTVTSTVAESKTVTIATPGSLGSLSANIMFVPVSSMKSAAGGLKFWLKADAITGLSSGSAVLSWPDSSGFGNSASQATANQQPLWIANALGGQPVVRFDGLNDTLNLASQITTARSVFIVVKHASGLQDYAHVLGSITANVWDFHGGTGTTLFYNNSVVANVLNGTAFLNGLSATPVAMVKPTNYSVLSFVTAGNTRFDNIGNDHGYAARYWNGDYAEIMSYDTVLGDADRQAVELYLKNKYVITASTITATTGVLANNSDLSTVTITMKDVGNSALVSVTPVISVSGNGNTVSACSASDSSGVSTCTLKSSVAEGKVIAITSPAGLGPISVRSVFVSTSGMSAAADHLKFWLKADAITGLSSGGAVSSWPDSSGYGNNATQATLIQRPLWVANALGGQPVVRFDGSNDTLNLASQITAARTVFIVVKHATGTQDYAHVLGSITANVWDFHGGTGTTLFYNNSVVANVLNGTAFLNGLSATPVAMVKPTAYSVLSFVPTGNTRFDNIGNDHGYAARYWNGDYAEVITYDTALSDVDRRGVESYLQNKYSMASAANSTIASSGSPTANASDTATITLTLKDSTGAVMVGVTPTISVSGTGNTASSCTPSDSNGVSICTISSNVAETKTVTVAAPSVLTGVTTTVTFAAAVVSASQSTLSIYPRSLVADGSSTAQALVTLKDAGGHGIYNRTVSLASSRGGADTIAVVSATTDATGSAVFTVKSSTQGIPTLTATDTSDSVVVTQTSDITFLGATPIVDYQARIANAGTTAGTNAASLTSWKDLVRSANSYNGTLSYFGFNSTSGWGGNGGTTISSSTDGPYRLIFDGADDAVSVGSAVSGNNTLSFESWIKLDAPSQKGKVILSNGSSDGNGLTLRQSKVTAGALEILLGSSTYSDEVMQDSPVAYWKLDETRGTRAVDSVGTNHGTYPATGVNKGQTSAMQGLSTQLTGTSAVSFPAVDLSATNRVTVEFWYQPAVSPPAATTILYEVSSDYNSVTNGLIFTHEANGTLTVGMKGNVYYSLWSGATALVAGSWYHVVGVFDKSLTSSESKLYLNGVLNGAVHASYNSNNTNAFGSSPSFLGARNGASYFTAGRFDELAIYNTDIGSTRIAAHYTAGSKSSCQTPQTFTSGAWYAVAGVFDSVAKNLKLYVDGVLQCQTTQVAGTFATGSNSLYMGTDISLSNAWSGAIADLRWFASELSQTLFRQNQEVTKSRFPDVPTSITGIKLWLKADSIGNLSDGAAVTAWPDSSGLGLDFTQLTLANKPTYKTNIINGKPTIRFAGSQYLTNTSASLNLSSTFTVFTVLKGASTAQTGQAWMWGEAANGKRRSLWMQQTNGYINFSGYNANVTTTTNGKDNSTHVITASRDGNGLVKVYSDALLLSSGTPTLVAYTYSAFTVGANADGTEGYVDDIAEIIAFNSSLSDAERTRVESYLAAKYAAY